MDKMNQQFRFLLTSLAVFNRGVEHESAVAVAMDKMNQQFRVQFSGDVVLSYTPGYLH
jgi:hypothetical protein